MHYIFLHCHGIIQFIFLSIFYCIEKGYIFYSWIKYIWREQHSVSYLLVLARVHFFQDVILRLSSLLHVILYLMSQQGKFVYSISLSSDTKFIFINGVELKVFIVVFFLNFYEHFNVKDVLFIFKGKDRKLINLIKFKEEKQKPDRSLLM